MELLDILSVLTMLIFMIFWIAKFNPTSKFLYIFFSFIPMFSSNFKLDFFRPTFQGILILIFIINLLHWTRGKFNFSSINWIACFFLLIIGISYIGNNINDSTYFLSLLNLLMIMSTIFYVFRELKSLEKLYSILDFMAYLALILSIYALIEKILFNVRAESTFSNPNYLAFYLGIGFVSFMNKNNAKMKYIFMFIIALGIYATASRIVILGVVFIFLVHSIRLLAKKSFYKVLPIYIASILVAFFCFSFSSDNRFNTKDAENSDGERYAIMVVSMQIVKENPINGIGYGQFIDKFSNYIPYGESSVSQLYKRDEIATHNDYLRILDELGIPAFILAMFYTISMCVKCRENRIIWSMFVYTVIFSTAHNNINSFLFWFFIFLPIYYLSIKS